MNKSPDRLSAAGHFSIKASFPPLRHPHGIGSFVYSNVSSLGTYMALVYKCASGLGGFEIWKSLLQLVKIVKGGP